MSGGKRLRVLAVSVWLCVLTTAAAAETVYVAERFEIGIHDETNIDSVILAVIPSGTPLTVVSRDGDFVEVTTATGIKGWVDARYVVAEKPSVALLEERDKQIETTARALGDARAEVEVLRQRVSELQRDAATASHNSPGIAKPISLAANEDTAKFKEAERALEALSKENQQLKARVSDLQAMQIASEKSMAESEAQLSEKSLGTMLQGPVHNEMLAWTPWQWLMFGSILLLAFAAGGYVVDWESRRRHGGFRV
jgi:SH3 domain protein